MPDYNKAQIYKIVSPNHEKVYYGSTTMTLERRFSTHTLDHSTCSSSEIINAGNTDIKHVEWFPCDNKHALEDREAYFILNNWDDCVNKYVPGAIRRAGGKTAYEKTPEYMEKAKARRQTPEYKASEKARKQTPKYKAERKASNQTPIQCICGKWSTRNSIKQHQRSKKCIKIIEAEVAATMNDMLDQLCVIEA